MNNNLIKIKNLTKNFINNKLVVKVLKNLNLELEMGNIVALIGPSGSGKSTLLHLIALLDKPTTGNISILGKETFLNVIPSRVDFLNWSCVLVNS